MIIYTNSSLSTFRDCPRKYRLAYNYRLRPTSMPDYVGIGSAYHIAHEYGEDGLDQASIDPFIREAARACYRGWTPRLVAEYVAIELRVQHDDFAGGIDAIVRLVDGRLAVLERKTTATLDDDYWRRVELDSQVSGYFWLAREAGHDVQTVVYDVVERPAFRQLKATLVKKYRKDGALYANQREHDETPAEFFARCERRPEHYAMREVGITTQRIVEWRYDVNEQRRAIETGFAYRNTAACARRGSVCEYLSICHRSDLHENTPEGFVRVTDVHPELAREGQASQSGQNL